MFDDLPSILNDEALMNGRWRIAFKSRWRQVNQFSLSMNAFLFGPFPGAFHVVNVVIHAVNACIVFCILGRLGLDATLSLIGAILFVVHPLAANSVANICGRSSSLSSMFGFIAVGLCLSGHSILAYPFFILAVFTKEDTAMLSLPLAYFSGEYWWIYLVFPLMFVIGRWNAIISLLFTTTGSKEMEAAGMSPALKHPTYFTTAFTETVLRFPLWCIGLGQNIDPDIETTEWKSLRFAAALLISAVIVRVGFMASPVIQAGLVLAILSPMLLYWIVPVPDPVMENRAYFSLLGVTILFTYAASFAPVWLVTFGIAFLACVCAHRAYCWSDGITLWSSAVNDGSGNKPRVLANLACCWIQKNEFGIAEMLLLDAIKVAPNTAVAWSNLAHISKNRGMIAHSKGETEKTVEHFKKSRELFEEAVKRSPRHHNGWLELGQMCEILNDWKGAEAAFREAIRLSPNYHEAQNKLGMIMTVTERTDEAIVHLEKAIHHSPLPVYRYNLGIVHWMRKELEMAKGCFKDLPPGFEIPKECV